jgi:hypothetical protein
MSQPHLNLQRGLHHRNAARNPAPMPHQEDLEQHAGEQPTWKGGGREPAHPDDVGDDGEYISTENRRWRDGAGSSDS